MNVKPKLQMALAITALLTACGGGSRGSSANPTPSPTPPPTPTLNATELQGRWVTAMGTTPAQTDLIVPTELDSQKMEMWQLTSNLQTMSKMAVSTSGSDGVGAYGKQYTLGSTASPVDVSYTGSVNLTSNTLWLSNPSQQLTLNRTNDLKTQANLVYVSGAWNASSEGTIWTSWNVTDDGLLTGSSSTGCSYNGQLTTKSNLSVLYVSVSEICLGVTQHFRGVATYQLAQGASTSATSMTLVSTSDDGNAALVILFTR